MVGEEGAFVIGREEVLTEEELATTLKVNAQNEYLELDERWPGQSLLNAAKIGQLLSVSETCKHYILL